MDIQNWNSTFQIDFRNWNMTYNFWIEISSWNWKIKSNILIWYIYWWKVKISQSYTDSEGVNTLSVSTKLKDISIFIHIYMKFKNSYQWWRTLKYQFRDTRKTLAFILFTNLLKLAPLRPGLVRLAIFMSWYQ